MTRELMPIGEDLKRCEKVIEKGLGSFISVGEALVEIQAKRLYKERGYSAFSLYCEREWSFGKAQAYQLIASAKTIAEVSTIVDTQPANQGQVRELSAAPVGERAAVWAGVVEEHAPEEITAAVIREHVQRTAREFVEVMSPPSEPREFAALRTAVANALRVATADVVLDIVREALACTA